MIGANKKKQEKYKDENNESGSFEIQITEDMGYILIFENKKTLKTIKED